MGKTRLEAFSDGVLAIIIMVLELKVPHDASSDALIKLAPVFVFAEGKATTHWAENRGTVPAVWIAVDIPKEP